MSTYIRTIVLLLPVAFALLSNGCTREGRQVPRHIEAILSKSAYQNAAWGLRVVDIDTGEVIYDLNPDQRFLHRFGQKALLCRPLTQCIGPPSHICDLCPPSGYSGQRDIDR